MMQRKEGAPRRVRIAGPAAGRWAGAAAGTAGGAGLISWDQSTLSALRTPIPGAADIGEY